MRPASGWENSIPRGMKPEAGSEEEAPRSWKMYIIASRNGTLVSPGVTRAYVS